MSAGFLLNSFNSSFDLLRRNIWQNVHENFSWNEIALAFSITCLIEKSCQDNFFKNLKSECGFSSDFQWAQILALKRQYSRVPNKRVYTRYSFLTKIPLCTLLFGYSGIYNFLDYLTIFEKYLLKNQIRVPNRYTDWVRDLRPEPDQDNNSSKLLLIDWFGSGQSSHTQTV